MRQDALWRAHLDWCRSMKMLLRSARLCAIFLSLMICSNVDGESPPDRAATTTQTTVLKSITAKQLVGYLREEGYAAKLDEEAEDKNVVDMKINGERAVAFVWDEGTTIEFYIGFNDQTLSLAAINEWSRSNRVSRISIDDDGTASMSLRLHLNGGVTPEWIVMHAAAFRDDYDTFENVMRSK